MRKSQNPQKNTARHGYADGGIIRGFKLLTGLEASPYTDAAKAEEERKAAARAAQAKAAAQSQPSSGLRQYANGDALKRRMAAIDGYANGGMIRGKGTGTSDSIKTSKPVGTFIMPADSTEAIGEQTLQALGKRVPVALSNGEYELPPEQVHAVGVQVLEQMKNETHTPVRGFHSHAKQQEPRQFFGNGGQVNDMSRWQAAADALRQSNERIAAAQGRMVTQAPDGRFDEGKLAQAAEMVRQSRQRMGTQAPVANPDGSMNMQRVAGLSNMVANSRARGFNPQARQYLADGGVAEWDEIDAAKAAALAGGAAYKAGVTPTAVAGAAKNAASSVGQFAKAGRMAASNVSVLPKGFAPSSKLGKAGVVGALASTALDVAGTDTDQYRKRFGMETDNPSFAGDLGVRALGAASDLGNVMTLGLAGKYYRDKQETAAATPKSPTPSASTTTTTPAANNADTPAPKEDDAAPAPNQNAAPADAPTTPAASTARQVGDTGAFEHGRGQYSDNPNGMGFTDGFTGRPSTQNMAAMDALAGRSANQITGMAAQQIQQPMQQQRGFDAPQVQHSGNSWEAANNLRNLRVGMNSMRSTNQSRAAGLAAYKSALDADARARGAENEAGITAMRENAAIARQGMQEQGANFRDANRNALEAQRIGIAGQEAVFNRGVKGFDIQNAQRKQYIQSLMDAATTPEDRKAIAERFPDVYGRDSKTKMQFDVIRGKNDPITGAYSGDYAVAFDPETGTIQRMDIGGASQPDIPIPQAASERVVGTIYTAPNGQKVKWDGKGLLPV